MGEHRDTELSPRLHALRERTLAEQGMHTPAGWRALAFARAMLPPGLPLVVRRALILEELVAVFPVAIRDHERLVGHHLFGQGNAEADGVDFPDLVDLAPQRRRELLARTALSPEQQEQALAGALAWERRRRELETAPGLPQPTEGAELDAEAQVYLMFGWCTNHSVRGYEWVLRRGFGGLARQVARRQLGERPEGQPGFLQAAAIVARAGARLGLRFAQEAARQAQACPDPARRRELGEIAAACRRVPVRPARTLREAIQALLFAHLLTCAEDHINANSLGRIDQMLGRYYDGDLAAGRLDREGARELVEELWLKLYQTYDVQQATVGGLTREGADATNEVSYLCLEATARLDLPRCLSVRLHTGTPRPLVELAARVAGRGGGIPFFFNDEAIIPALLDKGVRPPDARDYAIIGCVEITIPGKTNPHAVSHNLNLAKVLEITLHGGRDPRTGRQVGSVGPALPECPDYASLEQAFHRQLGHFARRAAAGSNLQELRQERLQPLPYQSLLTARCVARGRDLTAGGARYNYHSVSAVGIPNVADSLAALRLLVYQQGVVKPSDLMAALAANFAGYEPLRQALLRAPKYGNDDDRVDAVAARVAERYCRLMHGLRTVRGGRFHVHLFSFVWHVSPFGKTTGALPDGRRAGEPLAYSLSPMQGRDRLGLTAMLASLAKIPHHLAAGSSSAIIELDPSLLRGVGMVKFVDLLQAAVARGVGQMQFNVVDADTLRRAQQQPERYQGLCVRVSGYSYRFCLLDRDMQDHIIARVKHATT